LLKLGAVEEVGSRDRSAIVSSVGEVKFWVGDSDEEGHWDDLKWGRISLEVSKERVSVIGTHIELSIYKYQLLARDQGVCDSGGNLLAQ
jgi:hypothetical protein